MEVRSDEGRSGFVRLSLPVLDAVARVMLGLLVLLAYPARIVDEAVHISIFLSDVCSRWGEGHVRPGRSCIREIVPQCKCTVWKCMACIFLHASC